MLHQACGCALDFLKIEVSKHGTFIIHPLIDAANEGAGNQGCRFVEMDDIFDFFFTQAGDFLMNASDEQIIFMSPSRQQAGLGAGTGEERVEPHGGTDAQCHRRAEELGSREAEPGAGIADHLENSQGVVLRRRVRFVPDCGTVFTNGDAIGEVPPVSTPMINFMLL